MKKIATLALALLLLPSANIFAASENDQMINKDNKIETTSQARDEKASQTDLYEVSEVFENTVTLKFVQTVDGNSIPSYNGAEYNVLKEKFAEKDINVGDLYKINHDDIIMPSNPAQFGKIFDLKKYEKEKTEKNENEETITETFIVDEITEKGYNIHEKSNKDNKYYISKEDTKTLDLAIGDQLKITHTGLATRSIPAHFVGDIKVRKINNKESDTKKNIGNSKINSINKNINANKLAGLNPKTGVFSSIGILGVGAAAGILSKNTKE